MAATFSLALALVAALSAMCGSALAADCSVDVDSGAMPSPQPVLLVSGYAQDFSSFLLPNLKGDVKVTQGQRFTVACPGSSFLVLDAAEDHVAAECVGDTIFSVSSTEYSFNGLACTNVVTPTARYTSASCGVLGRFAIVEVGFTVGTEFHRLYDVCFSKKTLTTAYAHHTIPAVIEGTQKTSPSGSWTNSSFYGEIDIEAAYSEQNVTIQILLNTTTDNLFAEGRLERGALAPAADFMLEAQRAATYFDINSAPRWSQLDEGNWGKLENVLRNKAIQRGNEFEVYTGTHEVLALNNNEGVPTAIYLSVDSGSEDALGVPKYFWKIVYEPQSGLSAAFITVNNPLATQQDLETRYGLCTDICDKIDWVTWDQDNQTAGLSFCCEYNEFKGVVPGVPELDVKGYRESSSQGTAPSVWLTAFLVATMVIKSTFDVV